MIFICSCWVAIIEFYSSIVFCNFKLIGLGPELVFSSDEESEILVRLLSCDEELGLGGLGILDELFKMIGVF